MVQIGGSALGLGVIGSVYAFEALKKTSEHSVLRALFYWAVTAGVFASLLGVFQIRYGKNKNL